MLFQKVQQIYYPSNKYDFFPRMFIFDQLSHETVYILHIVLRFHPPFEPITALFTITGL